MFGESHIFLWTALATATLLPPLTSVSGPILLISVDLWLPSSLFPFLPPQTQTRPWLCPTPTAHPWLFWGQLAAVSSSVCIHSSFSWVSTPNKSQSLVEAAFPGHQAVWSPQWHIGIIPQPCGSWAGALGLFLPIAVPNVPMHTQDICVVPSFCFEDKSTKWSHTSACGTPLPIHWHGWQHCSQFPWGCGFK